jgi:protein-disulfide isomerase/uncharacterized membrane protein
MSVMSVKRSAAAVAVLSAAGLAISLVISWVHSKLAEPGYVSFCSVNETVNCDVVLSSKHAYLFGIPVAWLAVLAYVAFVAAAVALRRESLASRRRQLASAIMAAATGALGFSLYLAYVALVLLRTVCLLCTGLYVVNAGLIVVAASLYSAVQREGRRGGRDQGSGLVRWMVFGAAASLLVVLAAVAWEAGSSRTEIDPDFERWYDSLPLAAALPPARHVKGGSDAPVVITEFSDFECGHCAKAYRAIKSALPRFGKDVRVVFHHFPLDPACNPSISSGGHRSACLAAMAAECASQQGKFWEYHDLLFDNQESLSRDRMLRFADELDLERARFEQCLASDDTRRAVQSDIEAGERLQITSTPTMFFNRRTVRGALEGDVLESAIRVERALTVAGS